jgi:hypothetical protein
MTDVRVYFQDTGDRKLEDAIILALETAGLEFWASGTDLRTGERELCFDYTLGEE